jgi:hypothetical protein
VTSATIVQGTSSVSFFYGDTKAGTPTLSASGSLITATQQETVTPLAASKFAFTNAAASGSASSSANLGPITVQEQDSFGNPVTAGSGGTLVSLSSTSTGTKVFSRTSGGASVPSVTIAQGSSTASFFYGDTKAGTPTLTASGLLTSGTQQETISAGTASALCFVVSGTACISGTQTVGNGGSFNGRVQLLDAFQNPVAAGVAVTINLSPMGDLQTPNPTSLTILAGQSLSTNQVTDTLNNGSSKSGTLTGHTTSISVSDATASVHA